MSASMPDNLSTPSNIRTLKTFRRFTSGQRWEHWLLLLSFSTLLLTGLPQRYRTAAWSQQLLSTPEQLHLIQTIHHIAAVILILEAGYHLLHAFYLLARRQLSGEMLPTWQDIRDAGQMVLYLLFLRKEKPAFGKYNFEQKFTYWFLFFAIGIMITSGLVIWFPIQFTRLFPGSIIPAAKIAHGTEAVVAGIFVIIWHFYHVHLERLNLSIFTGWLNERDMQKYHALEYQRLAGKTAKPGSAQAETRPANSRNEEI